MKKELTCEICHQIYTNPITLYCCGKNICMKHLEKIISGNSAKKFTCLLCNEENYHQKFTVNKFMEKLIAQDLHKYKIDSKYEETFNNLEKEIETIGQILKDPEHAIDEEINKLMGQVELERESLKSRIDERANDLIQQLESISNRLKTEYKTNVDLKHYNSLVESSRKHLEEYETCLNLFSAKHQEREEKNIESEVIIKKLQSETTKLKDSIFSNSTMSYTPFKGSIENLYGQIITLVSRKIVKS